MAGKSKPKKGTRPVACPRCQRPAGQRCATPGGKELAQPHTERLQLQSAVARVNGARLRGPLPGQYTVIERVSTERTRWTPALLVAIAVPATCLALRPQPPALFPRSFGLLPLRLLFYFRLGPRVTNREQRQELHRGALWPLNPTST